MSDFDKLVFHSEPIAWETTARDEHWYIVGPKAVDNLKANGVYQEWLDAGLLRVDVPLEGYEGTFAMVKG